MIAIAASSPTAGTLADLFDEEGPFPESAPQQPAPGPERSESKKRPPSTGKWAYSFKPIEPGSGPVVLIVDDSSTSRQMVRAVVENLGFTPVEAPDGIEAIVQARYHEPALIVLDIVMPGRNGLEILKDLRKDPKFAATPIIMLTARSERTSIESALFAKANDYLVKPVKLRELEKRIKQYIEESES